MSVYKVAFISLGCAKNLVNTEQMAALVRNAGHTLVSSPEGADVCVLNTCGFIDSAKSEAIDHILYLAHLKEEGQLKKILVAGCLSQRYRDDIRSELPEVDGMLGTGSYTDVVEAIEAVMAGESPERFGDISHTYEDGERLVSTVPWSAYLKIAEGCDNYCAFCIIPYLRGHYRSRTHCHRPGHHPLRHGPVPQAHAGPAAAGAVQAGFPLDPAPLSVSGSGHR